MDINNTNNKQQIPFDMLAEEETQSSQAYSPYLIASHDPNMPSLEARLAAAKKSYLKDRIQNHFPLPLAISYIIYMSLVSLTAIILQTILIWNRIDYWQTFNGFWIALFIISLIIINVLLSNFKLL